LTPDSFDISGRSAVVTGGSSTVGRSLARGLSALGARVGVLALDEAAAHEVADDLRASGRESMALSADVLNRGELEKAALEVVKAWGGIDILVNAAGGNMPAATLPPETGFLALDVEALRRVVDLNLVGTLLPIQVFCGSMIVQGKGSIINISSMAAGRPLTPIGAYGAAKAAVENLTRWLAVQVAQTYGPGIRVNAIAPGFLVPEGTEDAIAGAGGNPSDRAAAVIAHTPMGRFGTPDDLIGAAGFLASDASSFVTGAVLSIDGGFSAFGGV